MKKIFRQKGFCSLWKIKKQVVDIFAKKICRCGKFVIYYMYMDAWCIHFIIIT